MLITHYDKRSSTTARNQSVAVSVKGATGLSRLILTYGEGHQTVERSNAEHVGLLGTTTDDAVLQTVLDEQIAQT